LELLNIRHEDSVFGIEKKLGNLLFTSALVASLEVLEVIKILIKRVDVLSNQVLYIFA